MSIFRLVGCLAAFQVCNVSFAAEDIAKTYDASFAPSPEAFFSSARSNMVQLDGKDMVRFVSADEGNNISAQARIAATYEGICFQVLVEDAIHWQSGLHPETAWNGDSLQIAFQTSKESAHSDLEFVVASSLTPQSPTASVWQAGAGFHPEGINKLVRAEVIRNGTMTEYRVFFPWQLLYPLNPFEAKELRASFVVNNNDGGSRAGYLQWSKGIGESKSSRFYPRIQLPNELAQGQPAQADFVFIWPAKTRIDASESLHVLLYGAGKKSAIVRLEPIQGDPVFEKNISMGTEITRSILSIKDVFPKLEQDSLYQLVATCGSGSIEFPLFVFDEAPTLLKRNQLAQRLEKAEALLPPGESPASVYYAVSKEMLSYVEELLNKKQRAEADKILGDLDGLLSKLENAIAAASKGEKDYTTLSRRLIDGVPLVQSEKPGISVSNGWFYENGRPVWLNGFVAFVKFLKDWEISEKLGMRVVHMDINANAFIKTPDPAEDGLPQIASWGQSLAKHNTLLISQTPVQYLPDWLRKKYPDGAINNTFWHFSPFHPAIKPALARFYKQSAEVLNNFDDCVLANNLTNEPFVFDFSDTGPDVLAAFRNWLKERYGGIETLNQNWGRNFRSFDEVEIPITGNHDPDEVELPHPVFYDWLTFRRQHLTSLFHWMNDEWKKYSNIPTTNKLLGSGFVNERLLGHGTYRTGIDVEAISRETDYLGCDMGMGFSTVGPETEAGSTSDLRVNFVPMAYGYDLLRSFGSEKPLLNTENHLIKNASPGTRYSASYMRAALWGQTLHGMAASTMWVWERIPTNKDLSDTLLTRPESLEGFAMATREINHFLPLISQINQLPHRIGIISSWPSSIRNPAHFEGSIKTYESLAFLGQELRFITERGLANRDFGDFKILIASHVTKLDAAAFSGLREFVEKGGVVVTIGDSFGADEYGKPRTIPEEFTQKLLRFDSDFIPAKLADTVRDLLKKRNAFDAYELTLSDGGIPMGVEWRLIPYSGAGEAEAILILINWSSESKEVVLRNHQTGKIAQNLSDLISEKMPFPLILAPLDVRLLALTKDNR